MSTSLRNACVPLMVLTLVSWFSLRLTTIPSHAQQPATTPRAERIHEDLRGILASPEFAVTPPGESFAQRAGKWLRERWDAFKRWWNRLFSFGGRAGEGTAQFLMWVVLAILIFGISYVLAYALKRGTLRRGRRTTSGPLLGSENEAAEERIDDPDGLLAAARELAAAGNYRRAYRAAFLAILLRLDSLGVIRYNRAQTNGEHLRALRSRPDVLAWMRPLTNDFDLRWYGSEPVGEADYRRILGAYERISPETRR